MIPRLPGFQNYHFRPNRSTGTLRVEFNSFEQNLLLFRSRAVLHNQFASYSQRDTLSRKINSCLCIFRIGNTMDHFRTGLLTAVRTHVKKGLAVCVPELEENNL